MFFQEGQIYFSDNCSIILFSSEEKIEIDFENLITPIMEQIFNNKVENNKLSPLRDTLLPKLMNGEINF